MSNDTCVLKVFCIPAYDERKAIMCRAWDAHYEEKGHTAESFEQWLKNNYNLNWKYSYATATHVFIDIRQEDWIRFVLEWG